MMDALSKFKIPTILGLGIIILGLISGVYLVLREQVFFSQAAPSLSPPKATLSNITDTSITISWQTDSPILSFVTYGIQSPKEETALDDRDNIKPTPRTIHYVTIKNLSPQTPYQFKIQSGKVLSEIFKFETAKPLPNKAEFTPIIGYVMLDDQTPLNNGIAFLSITETITQSAPVKNGGNFLIPLSKIQIETLPEVAKLTIVADQGEANALIKLKMNSILPPLKLGQNVDLTMLEETPQENPTAEDLNLYDLNIDRIINANDYAIVSSCFDKKPSSTLPEGVLCNKTDISRDGRINQKDLDMMFSKLKSLGFQ